MICPHTFLALSDQPFLCNPPSYCSFSLISTDLRHPSPRSFFFFFPPLCHSEDWIIHACLPEMNHVSMDSRIHVIGSYTPHPIDAVSRSHDVAVTMLLRRRHRKSEHCKYDLSHLKKRLASVFATPKRWRTGVFGERLCVRVRLWSPPCPDALLTRNIGTPECWWLPKLQLFILQDLHGCHAALSDVVSRPPEPTTRFLRTSAFCHGFFRCVTQRNPSGGLADDFLSSSASLLSFSPQVSRRFKAPQVDFASITFIRPLIRKRLRARTVFDWSIGARTYGGEFRHRVRDD